MPPTPRPTDRSTIVLLVRHGQTPITGKRLPGRLPGLGLADAGRRQAEAAAQRIAALPKVHAVYASPLERARETAAPIAKALGLAVQIERGLIEIDPGEWTRKSLARLRRKPEWKVVQRRPSAFRFPGGESFVEVQARAVSTVESLVARHRGETIVAVSHGDPIRLTVANALGVPLDLFQRISIATGSITAVAFRPEGITVLTVNSIDGDLAWLGGR